MSSHVDRAGRDARGEAAVPTTRAVGELLGVAGDRLKQYVECHSDPSVANVVAIADSVSLEELDTETRAGIDRWIDDIRAPDPGDVLEDAADEGDNMWPELLPRGFEVDHE